MKRMKRGDGMVLVEGGGGEENGDSRSLNTTWNMIIVCEKLLLQTLLLNTAFSIQLYNCTSRDQSATELYTTALHYYVLQTQHLTNKRS